ncbi:hypothetical protein BDV96DRAFT_655237 [Lophiotrema nucula]|uniref:Uncharacterized protein n=1 Tax=Lophiotrema nucula TaxID=690887 RepID=A0A6A5YG25_9PLEO|nr:hypothetical protein BDV96DRAFT_655237 [Lophiotrema nucula]
MFAQSAISLALVALTGFAAAIPVDSVAMGSKHTVYLATSTRFSAVAYYANGPVSSSQGPTAITTSTVHAWEGTKSARIGTAAFSSTINAGADALPEGQIAGSAKLGTEDLVCFSDGATTFGGEEDLGLTTWTCTADYWCPSIAA